MTGRRFQVRQGSRRRWLTQAAVAELFHTTPQDITFHVKETYEDGELDERQLVRNTYKFDESAETQTWLAFAHKCGYLNDEDRSRPMQDYGHICGSLVKMMTNPEPWCGPSSVREDEADYGELSE